MINAVISWSIHNRFLVLIATLVVVGFGAYALKNTPVDAIPDLSDVQVIIKTSYPGQAPQVVEDQVTNPLTSAMLSVPGAVTVRGYSFFGDSYVYVIFEDETDMYWARSRVLEYLNQVSDTLPESAKPQLGPDATGVGWVYIYALADKTGKHDLAELRSIQDWFLKYELQSVPGVSEVASVGGMVRQYQVEADPELLRAYEIPLQHIGNAIKQANQEAGASVIEMAEAEYMVRVTGYLSGIEDIENISLGISDRNTPLLLKDIASVRIGPQMRRGVAELNGEGEVVGGIVVMRFGENAQTVINDVKAKLESLKLGLPSGVEIVTTYDRSSVIENAIDNLYEKLGQEFLVVVLICAAFLFHLRSSLVVIVSLPVGILVAFSVMHLQGLNANIMSLGGIAIAIGAMVDGAIVMIENVHKQLEKTPLTDSNRWDVIAESCREVGAPLFFSLLIITMSFLPVFTLEAQEGKLFAPLAYTKTYAMAAAAGISVTLVPVLIGLFVRGKVKPERKNPFNRVLVAIYTPVIRCTLTYPKAILGFCLVAMVAGFWPVTKIGSEFMPPLDEGDLMYMPTTYPALSIGKAREILQQTDKLIKTVPEVETVFGKIGRAETATDPAPLTMIETFIQLKPKSEWRDGVSPKSLRKELDSLISFPGLTNAWVMPIKTRIDMLSTGIKTPVGIKVSGPDLSEIEKIGKQLEDIVNTVDGTASAYSERVVGGRYIKVDIDRARAARYGMSVAQIQNEVRSAVGAINLTQTIEGLERYPVNLRYPQHYRDSESQLALLPIVTPTKQKIALADVANVYIDDGPPMIKSENARLNGWTLIDIEGRDLGSYVREAQAAVAERITLPPGYSIAWSGQYEYLLRAQERLSIVVPLTLAIIVFLLYLNFRNLTEVMIIMGTIPFALLGGLWLMFWLDFNMSIAVAVGFIALAGVAAEIGVLMLVYLNQSLRELIERDGSIVSGQALKVAVIRGASLRLRPIMMTVLSIVIGLIPVMLGDGTGSEVMRRIAGPMIGGMISTLLLTLIVIPVIYFLWKKRGTD